MKVSEVTVADIKSWGNIEIDDDDDMIQRIIMPTAKARLRDHTGLDDEALDQEESIALAFLALCVFLYDNRTLNIVNDKQNEVVQSFLDAHRINFL